MASSNSILSDIAYSKILLHCAKYPWANVFGILLSNDTVSNEITDVIPLFHTPITAPTLEAALILINQLCIQQNKRIYGSYYCGEEDSVAKKITQQLALKTKTPVYFLVVNKLKIATDEAPFQLLAPSGSDWKVAKLQVQPESSNQFDSRLARNVAEKLVDFDDCLEDVSKDFRNPGLF